MKNKCQACRYPDFALEAMEIKELCKKHQKKQEELIKWIERDDEWHSLFRSGSNYRIP